MVVLPASPTCTMRPAATDARCASTRLAPSIGGIDDGPTWFSTGRLTKEMFVGPRNDIHILSGMAA